MNTAFGRFAIFNERTIYNHFVVFANIFGRDVPRGTFTFDLEQAGSSDRALKQARMLASCVVNPSIRDAHGTLIPLTDPLPEKGEPK
jgi:hypothetical protein